MYACVYINWLKECITYIILKIGDNQIFPAKRYQQYFHCPENFSRCSCFITGNNMTIEPQSNFQDL